MRRGNQRGGRRFGGGGRGDRRRGRPDNRRR